MFTIVRADLPPKSCIVVTMSSSCSDVVKNTTLSSLGPADANCFANRSPPDPGTPVARAEKPLGSPPMRAWSSAPIPVDPILATRLRLHGDRLVADEVHHVPDVLGLVLLPREDEGRRLLAPQVVDHDVEELAQDLRVVVDREAVDAVHDDHGAAALRLPDEGFHFQHDVFEHRRGFPVDRVRVLLRGAHHDLRDAVHEPDALERDGIVLVTYSASSSFFGQ